MKEYKQKRLAEYCEKFGLCQQKGSCQCAMELKFISETIDQAVVKERGSVVTEIKSICNSYVEEVFGCADVEIVRDKILSSLDKLTDKDI